jgi:hypothetical protein
VKPLFPAWGNSVLWLSLVLLGAGVIGFIAFLMIWARTPYSTGQEDPIDQPVKFDHRHHARDDGISCLYCHGSAQKSPYAGVPPTELCMNCHSQVWTRSPEVLPVRASYFEGTPIHWQRVHSLPGFVYFDHSIHVAKGVGCVSCHGRIDQMAQVLQVESLSMGWCLDCHRNPEAHLRPPEHVADMDWVPDRPQTVIGPEIKEQLHVNPTTDCTGCHR